MGGHGIQSLNGNGRRPGTECDKGDGQGRDGKGDGGRVDLGNAKGEEVGGGTECND